MTMEDSLQKLKEALNNINADELREYLSTRDISEFERIQVALDYLQTRKKGVEYGLIPVIKAILEFYPLDKIPDEDVRDRIAGTGIEASITSCESKIDKINEDIAAAKESMARYEALEEELEKKKIELDRRNLEGMDVQKKYEELKQIVDGLEQTAVEYDKDAQYEMSQLFDGDDFLENYERFLSACLKGRKMTLPARNGADTFESEDARIIHEFMVIKSYLEANGGYTDGEFNDKYQDIMSRLKALTDESKEFFRDYMDATKPKIEKFS